jgi:hypothetical protein
LSLLPKEKTKPKGNFNEYITLIYGAPKIGKSTLANEFNQPLFIATEPGLNSLEVYSVDVPDWETFLNACAEIAKGDHNYRTIIIDTVDNLFKFCSFYVCKRNNIQHESDLDWGKGWHLVKEEFFRVISKLSHLKYGLVFISHGEPIEIKTRTGTITKWVPTMNKQAKEIILPLCDFIFFITAELTPEGYKRVIKTKPSENWEAGDRTGKLPPELGMSYPAIKEAFDRAITATSNNISNPR